MALNVVFIFFFLCAFAVGLIQLFTGHNPSVFSDMVQATFEMSKLGFEISLGLTGVLTLWLGFMKIGETGGAVQLLSRMMRPFFVRLFPGVPEDHPAHASIMMNFSANMLGLDNAATPLGLKAMQELQSLNPDKETASDAQIMFLVLNTSGLTVIPVSIMVYRAQLGAANPADIFVPILLTTFFSTLAGLLAVSLIQRIRLWDPVILAYIGAITALVFGIITLFSRLPQSRIEALSTLAANLILFSIIIGFIGMALFRRINVYESFIEGAKEGFQVAIKIIPYLVAILVAIGVFRASGSMEWIIRGIESLCASLGLNTDFVPAMPTALMKPLSGSGARGMMIDAMNTHGADSFVGRLASTFQGSTDTTFYVLAVYFGSVSIKNTRHALPCGLIADFTAIIAGIFIAYLFFS